VVELAINSVVATILLATAVGLWRLHPVMEYHHATGNYLSTTQLALRLWPAIVALPIIGLAIHVLGKYKADFRRGARVLDPNPQ
jgi:hypothetical protein